MKTTAIIAEFNPLHFGHMHLINKIKSLSPDTRIIILMSGNFTQRGEPAVFNKWIRTKMALNCGADAVIELPLIFAISSAENFALGACRILSELNCIDTIAFGAENADINKLWQCAKILHNENEDLKTEIKRQLNKGYSYANARLKALKSINKDLANILNCSNNILAVEYLKAQLKLQSEISPLPIARIGSTYNDDKVFPKFSSASALRNELRTNGVSNSFLSNIPYACSKYYKRYAPLINYEYLFRLILIKLRTLDLKNIAKLQDVSEGLEFRIKEILHNVFSYDELVSNICTRRYSKSRIKRILLYSIFSLTKNKMNNAANQKLYARILGIRKNSNALSILSKASKIPVIIKPKDFLDLPILKYDFMATEVYGTITETLEEPVSDLTKRLITV